MIPTENLIEEVCVCLATVLVLDVCIYIEYKKFSDKEDK